MRARSRRRRSIPSCSPRRAWRHSILKHSFRAGRARTGAGRRGAHHPIEPNRMAGKHGGQRAEKARDPQATAVEPLRLEGEVAQERQRWDSAARRRVSLMRQLNTLLGRPLDEAWTPLALPTAAELPSLPNELSRLPVANPMLLALTGSTRAAQAGVEFSGRSASGSSSVGAESSVYSGGRFIETLVGAKMTIPWGNRSVYQANIDRSRQHRRRRKVNSPHWNDACGARPSPLTPRPRTRRSRRRPSRWK